MNLSDTTQSPVELIRAVLLRVAGTHRTGGQIRSLIDATCPDFDLRAATGVLTGPGALTKFLSTYFADIVHPVGKSGGDPIYSIGSPGRNPTPKTDDTALTMNLWAVFASPGLHQQVVFDRATGRVSLSREARHYLKIKLRYRR